MIQRNRSSGEIDDRAGGRQPRQPEDDIVAVQLRRQQLQRRRVLCCAERRECNRRRENAGSRGELAIVAAHAMLRREHVFLQSVTLDEVDRDKVARCAAVNEAAR